ncbi:hypothetical protein K435DRAFT_857574 [Dendrothele bispora CBS 962.96]|uniref:Uncharacterized protein n=1 Tax=Dendrothele bispora (strain CBS 962.96) TaxID=1314807 RepID=A0A4V4HG48_DENBC|nr:hypothetical protein K435DRAFT_857574 [Dendrothele bispora CBS 962.96]
MPYVTSFGRSGLVKPHVLALWYIAQVTTFYQDDYPYAYPDNIWDSPSIFSHYTSWYQALNFGKSLFNQATLHKVDEWLTTDIWSSSKKSNNSDFRKHVGKTLSEIPDWLKKKLYQNENDLEPHWTETQTAISKISSSESSVGSGSDSVEPASWVSGVVLFTLAKIYGLGSLTAQYFVDIVECSYVAMLLEEAPLLSSTTPFKKFHEALKRSGHTCWSGRSHGPNSLTNLYSSAYSLLLDTSNVPVVGCDERYHDTKCAACHAKHAFYDLSLVLDEEPLGPLESLSDKDKQGSVKRLIIKFNYARYENIFNKPLNHCDLMLLTKKLSSLSNLFQYALDNGKDMDLFSSNGTISLGYGPKNQYSDYSDSDPEEDTKSSGPSRPESSARSLHPFFNQEEDTPSLGDLENSVHPSCSVFDNSSPHAYHNTSMNLSISIQDSSQTQNVSEGQTTLLHPPHPPSYPSALPTSHLEPLIPSQTPIFNQQSQADYNIQSHSGSIRPTDLLNMPHLPSQEIQNEQAGIQELDSGGSTQHVQQTSVSSNAFNIPNPLLLNDNWSPLVLRGQTFENSFISETHNTKPPRPPRVDKMRTEIKKQLISMLEYKKIQITGGKLPWRNLFRILQEHKCEFENWPTGTPKPSTQNGIEKAPQDEIKAIYKALFDKECPLRIRRIDGRLGGADRIFISQGPSGSGSGNKRSRDEQGSNAEERESNRRRLRILVLVYPKDQLAELVKNRTHEVVPLQAFTFDGKPGGYRTKPPNHLVHVEFIMQHEVDPKDQTDKFLLRLSIGRKSREWEQMKKHREIVAHT